MTGEIIPVLAGLCIGLLLTAVPLRYRTRVACVASIAFGVAAAVVSGEFQMSPAFGVYDAILVGVSSGIVYVAVSRMRALLNS